MYLGECRSLSVRYRYKIHVMLRVLALLFVALLAGCPDGDAPPPFDQGVFTDAGDAGADLSKTD
jgi:hypothetical protein